MITNETVPSRRVVERVQTGVRVEKRLLKVLKALAELHDLSLGDLLEGIVLHAFEGKAALRRGVAPAHRRAQEDLRPRPRGRGQPSPGGAAAGARAAQGAEG